MFALSLSLQFPLPWGVGWVWGMPVGRGWRGVGVAAAPVVAAVVVDAQVGRCLGVGLGVGAGPGGGGQEGEEEAERLEVRCREKRFVNRVEQGQVELLGRAEKNFSHPSTNHYSLPCRYARNPQLDGNL